jgi:hypothetical protein
MGVYCCGIGSFQPGIPTPYTFHPVLGAGTVDGGWDAVDKWRWCCLCRRVACLETVLGNSLAGQHACRPQGQPWARRIETVSCDAALHLPESLRGDVGTSPSIHEYMPFVLPLDFPSAPKCERVRELSSLTTTTSLHAYILLWKPVHFSQGLTPLVIWKSDLVVGMRSCVRNHAAFADSPSNSDTGAPPWMELTC